MSRETSNAGTKSLSDKDIATYPRRSGPAVAGAGTDVDAHSDSDAPAVATDHDTAAATDKDT